jgi:hypothetical protein
MHDHTPLAILFAHEALHRLVSALNHYAFGHHAASGTLDEFYFYCMLLKMIYIMIICI